MTILKKLILKTPGFEFINKVRLTGTLQVQELSAQSKAELILSYAKKYKCKKFIETGTFKGDTVDACKDFFEEITSIELSHELFLESKARFASIPKIHILEGNSGDLLPQVVTSSPVLFWLDAHYSGGYTAKGPEDSPVMKELNFILNHRLDHCILIDDARCFTGKIETGYPTIPALKTILKKDYGDALHIEVKNDIIRITKKNESSAA